MADTRLIRVNKHYDGIIIAAVNQGHFKSMQDAYVEGSRLVAEAIMKGYYRPGEVVLDGSTKAEDKEG